jgi:KDO2-lipid IV(A) lauroyltransferase
MSNASRRPTFQHWLEYAALRGAGFLFGILPRTINLFLALNIAFLAFDVFRIRRRVTLQNLERAFPDLPPRKRRKVARGAYINLAIVGMEMLQAWKLDPQKVIALVDLESGSEALYHDLMKMGKGVVFVGGHYGNWELMAARTAAVGYSSSVIVQSQRNPLMDHDLNATRKQLGFNIVGRGQAVRGMLRVLKEGGAAMILADQDAGTKDGLFVDFFGHPASTYQGPAIFVARSGAPLIGATIRRKGGAYDLRYERLDEKALDAIPPDADEEARVRRLTEYYMEWLEEQIRYDPCQYLWLHQRWKSRPTEAVS